MKTIFLQLFIMEQTMIGQNLISMYHQLRELGLVGSKRSFSRDWLGRGKTYLRDYECRGDRITARVPQKTVSLLRARLCAVAERVPAGIAEELGYLVLSLDQSVDVAD